MGDIDDEARRALEAIRNGLNRDAAAYGSGNDLIDGALKAAYLRGRKDAQEANDPKGGDA